VHTLNSPVHNPKNTNPFPNYVTYDSLIPNTFVPIPIMKNKLLLLKLGFQINRTIKKPKRRRWVSPKKFDYVYLDKEIIYLFQ
jgi:hypothetical protein